MKLALSTSSITITEQTLEDCKKFGIGAIEVSAGLKSNADIIDFTAIKEMADKIGIELCSFHLPFVPFEIIDISQPSLAQSTVEYFCALIDKATDIGIKTFVVHSSGEPIDESDRELRFESAKRSLYSLAEYAKTKGATIAVEDLPRTCIGRDSSEILSLISVHPLLRVCFDTNHLLGEDIDAFIRAVGDKIVTTHISDYDFINERHWLPGEGQIDWVRLKNLLSAEGYNGPWVYELGLSGSNWTIDRPHCLTREDISRNFYEIMSGVAPTPVGMAKKDLPMFKPKT